MTEAIIILIYVLGGYSTLECLEAFEPGQPEPWYILFMAYITVICIWPIIQFGLLSIFIYDWYKLIKLKILISRKLGIKSKEIKISMGKKK